MSGLWMKDPEFALKGDYLDFTSSLPRFPDLLHYSVEPGPSSLPRDLANGVSSVGVPWEKKLVAGWRSSWLRFP